MKRNGIRCVIFNYYILSPLTPPAFASENKLGEIKNAIIRLHIEVNPIETSKIQVAAFDGLTSVSNSLVFGHPIGFGFLPCAYRFKAKAFETSRVGIYKKDPFLFILSAGRLNSICPVQVNSRRPLPGHWEYPIDKAISTMPTHHKHRGATLLKLSDKLVETSFLFKGDASTLKS